MPVSSKAEDNLLKTLYFSSLNPLFLLFAESGGIALIFFGGLWHGKSPLRRLPYCDLPFPPRCPCLWVTSGHRQKDKHSNQAEGTQYGSGNSYL